MNGVSDGDTTVGGAASEPIFIQTSDAFRYAPMLAATSRTVKAYCRRHGFGYESYVGVKRGYWPWQAAFNRVFMLQELIDRDHRCWVVYLDADAFIVDQAFDLRAYLADKSELALIATPSGATTNDYDINNGVFLINLAHPQARYVVRLWRSLYESTHDHILRSATDFYQGVDDQDMLQQILEQTPAARQAMRLESHMLLNSPHASFIRQYLRAMEGDLARRTSAVEGIVAELLGHGEFSGVDLDGVVNALYRGLLGRGADDLGLARYRGMIEQFGMSHGLEVASRELVGSPEFMDGRGLVYRN